EDFIENPVLAYMESYASSTSELVSEILQFMTSKKVLLKLEAEALLAGMTVDTNGFTVKTGVRTFDAAAWLRRQGADPTEVKRFFQEDFYNVKLKATALSEAQIFANGIAVAQCQQVRADAQVMCAQIADQLLTIKDIKASFVVGRNMEMKTVISARSLGEVNVQVIMEKFGGGGHLTTAAAQVEMSADEAVCKIMEIMEVDKQ
ncbi:MAG: DHH family phosphoesterase, partial [Firmicutes bacterium]|nr:DHH family phosphoesterase [Bacillota bacterium]